MKNRRQKVAEYNNKYSNIPRDKEERLHQMYDTYKIDDNKSREILEAKQRFLQTTYYEKVRIVMYEIPEHTPRPRARLINKGGIMNAAAGGNPFIQVYSITGRDNKEYMKMYAKENLDHLEQLLCTPCDLEQKSYFPIPSYYNAQQAFLAEIGLDRPVSKPDYDNIEKAYGDMFTDIVWIDDVVVIDNSHHKFYSSLPRIEIDLLYANQLCNVHQYKAMCKRVNVTPELAEGLKYFK